MNRIAAHVFTATVLASLAVIVLASGVLAKENPGNHYGKDGNPGNHYGQISNPGHHYGQLKHPKTQPPPVPTPNPTPQPVTHPASGRGGNVTVYVTTPGLIDGGTTSSIPVTVTLPAEDQTSNRSVVPAQPADSLDWLILLVLPALLAAWAIAAAGLSRNAARRFGVSRAGVPAPNPA